MDGKGERLNCIVNGQETEDLKTEHDMLCVGPLFCMFSQGGVDSLNLGVVEPYSYIQGVPIE